MIEVVNKPLSFYVDHLREGRPFSFARYGNGEWDCILGRAKWTGTKSQRIDIPQLQQRLADSVRLVDDYPHYYLAMQSLTYLERIGKLKRINGWVARQKIKTPWYNGEVFHKASMRSQLYPLVKQLRRMKVVFVGPSYLQRLPLKLAGFVTVKPRNCWADYREILNETNRTVMAIKGPVVVAFCAGPTAKVLIHSLSGILGPRCFLIDFGSMWDPYAGRNTRRYHARINRKVQRRNLNGQPKKGT